MDDYELFSIDRPRLSVPQEELIRELKAFSRTNKEEPISKAAYNRWPGRRFHGETITRHLGLGSWEDACRKAGVRFYKKHQYSDEEVIKHCQAVWRWRGQRPTESGFRKYNKEHGTTIAPILYLRRWGSLKNFTRLFSQYKQEQITLQDLIENKVKKEYKRTYFSCIKGQGLTQGQLHMYGLWSQSQKRWQH